MPVATTTVPAPVTTSPGAALPRECSYRTIDDHVTPRPGLPAAVDQTRWALIALAAARDFSGLDALAAQGEVPLGYDLFSIFRHPGGTLGGPGGAQLSADGHPCALPQR